MLTLNFKAIDILLIFNLDLLIINIGLECLKTSINIDFFVKII